jgi:predicted CoA-binding protein
MLANPSPDDIKRLLRDSSSIAVVGCSPKPYRPSHEIADFLIDSGYEVIPVNPGHSSLLDRPCYPRVSAIPQAVDIVNVFRRSEFVAPVVDDAIAAHAKAIWLQDGIRDDTAAERARAAGLIVIQDRCIMRDHLTLMP